MRNKDTEFELPQIMQLAKKTNKSKKHCDLIVLGLKSLHCLLWLWLNNRLQEKLKQRSLFLTSQRKCNAHFKGPHGEVKAECEQREQWDLKGHVPSLGSVGVGRVL